MNTKKDGDNIFLQIAAVFLHDKQEYSFALRGISQPVDIKLSVYWFLFQTRTEYSEEICIQFQILLENNTSLTADYVIFCFK
jgi:hypothetical protein